MEIMQQDKWKLLSFTMLVGAALFLISCATAQSDYLESIAEEIPDNANRIVIQQEDVPPANMYVDLMKGFQLQDWYITYAEENIDVDRLSDLVEDEPLVLSVRKQMTDDLAIWITGNIEAAPTGSRMVASVKYADELDTPTVNWQDARWTEGEAKSAFFEGLEAVRTARYDAVDYEVGVMVETNEQRTAG